MSSKEPGLTSLGKIVSILLIAGLVLGGWAVLRKKGADSGGADGHGPAAESGALEGVVAAMTEVPALGAPAPYEMKDNTLELELSDYAGYAGLLVANGGKEPNENSVFFKDHGFKVRMKFIDEDNWSGLNSGKFAASATTTDVLAVYGRKLDVVCPVLIGYSRGADGIVVRSDIKRINQLAGKVLTSAQFNESDFFIRYLAQEAGIGVRMLDTPDDAPDPDKINLLYCEDFDLAGKAFQTDLLSGGNRLAGCVTWAPTTTDVVAASGGKARLLTTNRNLLIVSDVLLVNRAFAKAQPKIISGLVQGLLEGNRRVRENPQSAYSVLKTVYNWDSERSRIELDKIHFANLPENQAYFSGAIDMAGSFGGIFQSAVVAYGRELLPDPSGFEKFVDPAPLEAAAQSGKFAQERISIAPVKTGAGGSLENDPLLTKDIRFYFEPNKFTLEQGRTENQTSLADVKRLLQVSPGSTLRLRGHVDNSNQEAFKKDGQEAYKNMALRAMKLSLDRANEIKRVLVEQFGVDAGRMEPVGRGWEEPVSTTEPEKNRRVEVQWFTLE